MSQLDLKLDLKDVPYPYSYGINGEPVIFTKSFSSLEGGTFSGDVCLPCPDVGVVTITLMWSALFLGVALGVALVWAVRVQLKLTSLHNQIKQFIHEIRETRR